MDRITKNSMKRECNFWKPLNQGTKYSFGVTRVYCCLTSILASNRDSASFFPLLLLMCVSPPDIHCACIAASLFNWNTARHQVRPGLPCLWGWFHFSQLVKIIPSSLNRGCSFSFSTWWLNALLLIFFMLLKLHYICFPILM